MGKTLWRVKLLRLSHWRCRIWEKGVERSGSLDLVPAVIRILPDCTKMSQFSAKYFTCIGSCLMKTMGFSVVPLKISTPSLAVSVISYLQLSSTYSSSKNYNFVPSEICIEHFKARTNVTTRTELESTWWRHFWSRNFPENFNF